ncbi:hypothetical protein EVAR_37086_1 [Eumeta japonica]|uniref:Uncharacterized protein n=1 Tax=Eumeta variegata TaxID=151549 RepID=A0A4C1WGN5_EUMVA|nr:hypothetical protein EVAR_37086_1 [Eumeta japonica]
MTAFCRRTPLPLRVLSLQRTWRRSRREDGGVLSPYAVTAPGALTAEDMEEEPTRNRHEDGGVLSPYAVTAPGAFTAEDVKEEPTNEYPITKCDAFPHDSKKRTHETEQTWRANHPPTNSQWPGACSHITSAVDSKVLDRERALLCRVDHRCYVRSVAVGRAGIKILRPKSMRARTAPWTIAPGKPLAEEHMTCDPARSVSAERPRPTPYNIIRPRLVPRRPRYAVGQDVAVTSSTPVVGGHRPEAGAGGRASQPEAKTLKEDRGRGEKITLKGLCVSPRRLRRGPAQAHPYGPNSWRRDFQICSM